MDTTFLTWEKTHFWQMRIYSIFTDLQRLGFHIISDNSVENLITHTPGKFLLKYNINSLSCPLYFLLFSLLERWTVGYRFLCKGSLSTSRTLLNLSAGLGFGTQNTPGTQLSVTKLCLRVLSSRSGHDQDFKQGACFPDKAPCSNSNKVFLNHDLLFLVQVKSLLKWNLATTHKPRKKVRLPAITHFPIT